LIADWTKQMAEKEMKLAVVGAAGRMGQTLVRMIHATKGARVFQQSKDPVRPRSGAMSVKLRASDRLAS